MSHLNFREAQKCYCGSANCRGFIGIVKSSPQKTAVVSKKKDKKKKEIFNDEMVGTIVKENVMLPKYLKCIISIENMKYNLFHVSDN